MRKNLSATLGVAAAICVAVALLSQAKLRAQGAAPLTAMDYIEIQQLVNKLNFALDYCTNGGNDFADLFVAGGSYSIDDGSDSPREIGTREELIGLAAGPDCEARVTPPSSYILHLSQSLVIESVPEGAKGTSYAIYPSKMGQFFREDVAGQLGLYHDVYVKTPAGWRFRSRRHETNPVVGEVEL